MRTTLDEAFFTEVMTGVRRCERSSLDTGEAADGSSDVPMDMGMEMPTAVIPIATETTGAETLEPMERNENRNGTRRSEVLAAAGALRD